MVERCTVHFRSHCKRRTRSKLKERAVRGFVHARPTAHEQALCFAVPMAHEMGVVSPSLGRSSTISGDEGAAEDCCVAGAAEVGADCKRSTGSPDEQAPEDASPLLEAPVGMEVPFMAAISSKSVMASLDALRMRRAWRRFSCYETDQQTLRSRNGQSIRATKCACVLS